MMRKFIAIAILLLPLMMLGQESEAMPAGITATDSAAKPSIGTGSSDNISGISNLIINGAFTIVCTFIVAYFAYRGKKAVNTASDNAEKARVASQEAIAGSIKAALTDALAPITQTLTAHGMILDNVNKEVTKTNGRVTRLEEAAHDTKLTAMDNQRQLSAHEKALERLQDSLEEIRRGTPKNKHT